MESNSLLERNKLPNFDLFKIEQIEPAIKEVLARSNKAIEALQKDETLSWKQIEIINEIEYDFSRTWGPVGHLMGVQNSTELREAYEKIQPSVVDFFLQLGQNKNIYKKIKALSASNKDSSPAKKRALELRIKGAEHTGIGLSEEKQKRFNEIVNLLSKLSTDFSNHVLDATKAWHLDITNHDEVSGFPESLLKATAQTYALANKLEATDEKTGPWRITLDIPCFMPLMQHATDRSLRENIYNAYIERASKSELNNEPLILDILTLRQEMAEMLGFENYAELSLDSKMADSVADVHMLFNDLLEASHITAQKEFDELQDFAQVGGFSGTLKQWDVTFWSERLRESLFSFSDEDLRPYFPLEKVLSGLFDLAQTLFGIKIEVATETVSRWHDDVKYFIVRDENKTELASFFLDPYSRPEDKRGGAWMNDCISRWQRKDKLELPVAYLVCNSTPPIGDTPSLMTFREVETLFHEFGHGLQHMLTKVDELDVSGISGVDWDAVELPSQFMENWCYHKKTLLELSSHYKTGESLPEELFERVVEARTFRSASAMLRQIKFSLIDIELHAGFDTKLGVGGIDKIIESVDKKTSFMPLLQNDKFLCSFAHIFAGGYAAGYYSYKWAEVLSADAFGAFEEAGLDDLSAIQTTGRKFKDTVLSLGGSKHPMEVFESFRGRKPSIDALLRHSGLA